MDSHLHVAICRAARNVLILDYCTAIDAARNQPRWHRLKQRAVTPEFRALYNRHHGDIVVALTERDANAAPRRASSSVGGARPSVGGSDKRRRACLPRL